VLGKEASFWSLELRDYVLWRGAKRRGDLPAKNLPENVLIGRRLPHLLKAGQLLVPLLREIIER